MRPDRPDWARDFPADWIVPDWPVPSHVRAVFTTRAGQFNLGMHVGDDATRVQSNRNALDHLANARAVFNNQIHGWLVDRLRADSPNGQPFDASVTTERGTACTAMVADCAPLLFCLPRSGGAPAVVGAAHAGWRGLLGGTRLDAQYGVIEAILESFGHLVSESIGSSATERVAINWLNEVQVWIGPCIGPAEFEVGRDVQLAFCQSNPVDEAAFVPLATPLPAPGKFLADLGGLIRSRLIRAGIKPAQIFGNDSTPPWCTVTNPQRFYSHRRDTAQRTGTGRMAALIWLA